MKTLLTLLLFVGISNSAFADTCYQLSKTEGQWTDKSDLLCFRPNPSGDSEFQLDLYSFASGSKSLVASYFLNSLPGIGLGFGVNAMTGSTLDESVNISISFGEVYIGSKMYYGQEVAQ